MFKQTDIQPEFLRRPQAAAFLGMSEAWLRKMERLGKAPERSRCGKSPVYRIETLRLWMQEQVEK